MFNGCILGRHAKGVPAHGVKHIKTLQAFEARHNIADSVIAHMTHMNTTRRIRKHFQQVKVGLITVIIGFEALVIGPVSLPFFFDFAGVIVRFHQQSSKTLQATTTLISQIHENRHKPAS